jgi:eukaryotic-like serine/threonine-protein kinase
VERASPSQREIGRYSLYGEIASGGMATVYVGRLNAAGGFGRIVAIKRLHAQLARDPEFVSMFLDEARLAARIHHPNVVSTLDVVQSEDELFVVMDYIRGESLSRLARTLEESGERIPIPVVTAIMGGMLQGLHAAHVAKDERGEPLGIVHRDVSPQNVLVGEDGVARVLDFGVAKAASRLQQTREGQLKGKLGYMSPEQISEHEVTAQSDIYAAGIVLWEALCGRFLFRGKSDGETLHRIVEREVVAPSGHNAAVSAALDAVVLRALALEPEKRFATARDMAIALDAAVRGASIMEVGEWVQRTAASTLQSRHKMVHDIESGSVDSLSGFPVIPSGLLGEGSGSAPRSARSGGQLGTAVTVHSRTQASPLRPRSRRWLGLGAVALIAGVALGFVLKQRTGATGDGALLPPPVPCATSAASAPPTSNPTATASAPTAEPGASVAPTTSGQPSAQPSTQPAASTGTAGVKTQPSTRPSATPKTQPTASSGNDLDHLIETRK